MINIKDKTADLLKEKYGISRETTLSMFEDKVLNEKYCTRVLVAEEYIQRSKSSLTKADIKVLISERYCISYSTVEKYVFQDININGGT